MGNEKVASLNERRPLFAAAARDVEETSGFHDREQSGTHRLPREHDQEGEARARRCGGHGEPMVLLHGFALCSEAWKPVLPALKQHHEVTAMALPGHLGSDPLPADYKHTIEAGVDQLERKMDALNIEQAHVVGNSLGGWLAIELGRRGRALSVIALAPGGGWELGSPQQKRVHRHFRLTRALLRVGGEAALRMVHWSAARTAFLRDCVAKPHLLTSEDAKLLIDAARSCAVYDDVLAAIPNQPPAEPFDELPCPMRIVWGAEDRLLPMNGYSERWRRVLPGAEWLVLPNVGHVQVYDDPEAVAKAILDVTLREQRKVRLAG